MWVSTVRVSRVAVLPHTDSRMWARESSLPALRTTTSLLRAASPSILATESLADNAPNTAPEALYAKSDRTIAEFGPNRISL